MAEKNWLQKAQSDPNYEESRKINEALIKKNPQLGLIDERVVYDKAFLLEVQSKGYNPLDAEDVQNYLNDLPSKYEERNKLMCGADKYKYLGQGEYQEDEVGKFMKKTGAGISVKNEEDIYLSDYDEKNRQILLEKTEEVNTNIDDVDNIIEENMHKYKNLNEAENSLRKNIAKAFGADNIKVVETKEILSESKEVVLSNDSISKTLELIKELRALGFSDEEIKQEIKLRSR